MFSLTTKAYHLKSLSTEVDCIKYFKAARSQKTVDLMYENVLRGNNIKINLLNFNASMEDAMLKELDEVVIHFIRAAAMRSAELEPTFDNDIPFWH